jgi:IclR family acetate operon transcriptional repressor
MPASGSERDPVTKALRLLIWMIDNVDDEVGVRTIATSLRFPPSTTHRLLTILESNGLVSRTATGKYRLGLEVMRLAWTVTGRSSIVDVARPYLEELVRECNETAVFGLYDYQRRQMMFGLTVDADQSLRYVIKEHEWMPVHAGASGLAILAFLPESDRRIVLSGTPLVRLTDNTLIEPTQLEEAIAQIRTQGYSITHEQRTRDAVGIAAPVWGYDERVLGDVLITVPEYRFEPIREKGLAELVISTANRISAQLGAPRHIRMGRT